MSLPERGTRVLPEPGRAQLPEALVREFTAVAGTLAVAESLTGGAVSARLVGVPGVSAVLRGGIVAYATDVKASLLGVDVALLAEHGPIHPQVAVQMACGVRRLLNAEVGVATTGVAGPAPQGGHDVGTVFVACAGESSERVREFRLAGSRAAVRLATVNLALAMARSFGAEQHRTRVR